MKTCGNGDVNTNAEEPEDKLTSFTDEESV